MLQDDKITIYADEDDQRLDVFEDGFLAGWQAALEFVQRQNPAAYDALSKAGAELHRMGAYQRAREQAFRLIWR